ncbi:hypothetical protein SAMN05660493_01083 [Epilithonimonas bovis DSM 19482]|uniref:Uncharacterized protein n=1 Tax=Epilithonimonas bovis DSM 19482 TaxID=1121284 RepID=A0A1U7PS66_9FLAO|nr:hypothetical protein [Epilithonimonas bovis]MDN5627188.1 hypothetical protein [Weeksellaceae bacterium]SIT96405.1 hypothetical protein SAMN05660493_01083 [Epilithonimonas bovis DSM 19482]
MKNIILHCAVILTLAFALQSCSKADDLVDDITVPVPFSVPVTFDTQIPLSVTDTVNYVKTQPIPFNADINAAIKSQYPAMSAANLKSAKLTQFKIQYKSSVAGIKLDVINNARLYLRVEGQSDLLVATASNNTSTDILNFTPDTTIELADILKTDQKYLILEVQGEKIASDQLTVTVDSVFRLLVGL